MSYPTKPAFISVGGWDNARSHPAMAWFEKYTNALDAKKFDVPASQDHTPDFTLIRSTGQVHKGADEAWKVVGQELYAPFSEHLHDPTFLVVWEEGNGYEMFGIANVYGNLAAPGSEPKVKGADGKEWDVIMPSAFKFHYVKDGESFKLSRTEIFGDPSMAVVKMLKRGMITPQQLTGA